MADGKKSQRWVFTRQELWQLLGVFAPAVLLGVSDPFFGWEAGRRDRAVRKLSAALRRKILADPDGMRGIFALRLALAACAHPRHSLIVTAQQAGRPITRKAFHFTEDLIVELSDLDAEKPALCVVDGNDALFERLMQDLRVDSARSPGGNPFPIQESVFFNADRAFRMGDPDRGREILVSAGVDATILEKVTGALLNPSFNASVIAVRNWSDSGRPWVAGWGLLESGDGTWMLRPSGKEGCRTTEWLPVGPDEIRSALWGMLP